MPNLDKDAESGWLPCRYAPEKTEENLISLRTKELTSGREIVGRAKPEETALAEREGRASVRTPTLSPALCPDVCPG